MKITRKTYDEVMVPCYVPQDMVLEKGKGCWLYDTEGNKYLDMTAGIAVNCLGHNHPGVVKAINKQARKMLHVSNVFVNDKTLTLAKKLVKLTGFERVFFVNSGAEANETALKLARRVAFDNYGEEKSEIISFKHSFHGRTFFSVSVGGQEKYYKGFGPVPGGITHLPYNDLETFSKTISDKTCAVIVEVVQGEGGILEGNTEFMHGVRELCTKHNAMLIFDEVQTGVGRTGTFYAYEQSGVKPDVVTTAKGLAAGVPIGGILTMEKFARHFVPGTHGSTFGGNPLACAVGCYVLDTVADQTFLDHVADAGSFLRAELRRLNDQYNVFSDVRGWGLMVGAQLAPQYSELASQFQKICTRHKLLVLLAGHDVIRFTPPLIITRSLIRKAMKILEQVIVEFLRTQELAAVTASTKTARDEAGAKADKAADKAAEKSSSSAAKKEKSSAEAAATKATASSSARSKSKAAAKPAAKTAAKTAARKSSKSRNA